MSSRTWPPRHANAILSDVYRETDQIKFDLSDLERWRDRLLDSIAQGAITDVSFNSCLQLRHNATLPLILCKRIDAEMYLLVKYLLCSKIFILNDRDVKKSDHFFSRQ